MRVNVYAEEMTNRIEIIRKGDFTGLRFYLELPVTVGEEKNPWGFKSKDGDMYPPVNGKVAQVSGPFMHHPGDDDSSAVTFWGKRDMRKLLKKALKMLDKHYTRAALTEREKGETK